MSCIDGVNRIIAQITLGIVPGTQCSIDCRTSLNGRVAVSCWKLRQPGVGGPIRAYVVTQLAAVARTVVAWFGNGLVADELSVDSSVKSIPYRS